MNAHEVVLTAVMAGMVAGAIGTTFARDVTRLVLSLGLFLVAVAVAFLALGSPLLAAAQVFVYVGGVLVLVLFALMVVRRSGGAPPRVESRHEASSALVAGGVFVALALAIGPVAADAAPTQTISPGQIADILLGSGLVAFELAGVLLLAVLLAVLVIVKSGGER